MLGATMTSARGFTLVEVLVALIVFAVGMLGLAAETAALTRQLARAQRAAFVSAAAATRLERLRAAACGTRADGAETVLRGGAKLAVLQWTWSNAGDSTYRVRLVSSPVAPATRGIAPPETLNALIPCWR